MYMISTQGTQYEQGQLEEFFGLLSPKLNEKVSVAIFLSKMKDNLQFRIAIMQIAKQYIIDNPYPKKSVQ